MTVSSPTRIETVLRATAKWQKDLVDTSGRNRLRRFRDLRTGTLDLTPDQAPGLDACVLGRLLESKPVSLSALFPNDDDHQGDPSAFDNARRRLTAIHKMSLSNLEEKGIETLFAAVGLATWEVESGAPPNAPVILLPLEVMSTGAANRDFTIGIAGDAHLNPVLTHILRSEHDIETDDEEVDVAETPPTSLEGFEVLFRRFERSWKDLPNFAIELRAVAANFSYSTMPLVTDLEQHGELFAGNDIVAAIAGDSEAREALASRICDPMRNQPDLDPPSKEFLVLDADSSQHAAINRVLEGESLVIQGPPGTGKSQTIANLITALIAQGKRVLFVAEKRAAIEAVTKRLEQVGLGDVVMDMHGGVTSRREFARTLNDTLKRVGTISAQDHSALHQRLKGHRVPLIANDAALHDPRDPWKVSVFEVRERVLAIPEGARTQLRLSTEASRSLDVEGFERLAGEIEEWIDLGGHALAKTHPEWHCSSITTSDGAQKAFDLVGRLVNDQLPAGQQALHSALDENQLSMPETVVEWRRTIQFLRAASGSRWERMKAQVLSSEYRIAKQKLGAPTSLILTPSRLELAEERVGDVLAGLDDLSALAGLGDLAELSHSDLAATLQRMASNRAVVTSLPRIRELEEHFRKAGAWTVIERIGEDISPECAARALEHAWLGRVLDDLEFEDQRLAAFDSSTITRHRDEFAKADCQHRDTTPSRVRRLTAEAVIATMNSYPAETALIQREAAKKRRHLSVRQLLARAPRVLSTLRPCWTMSPILAAEMIPADLRVFDTVIFDEASQIPPAEAIGSLARATQAVIAGDSLQLPPTSFFGRSPDDDVDEEENDLSLISDIESLLDVADALLRDEMLQWHYRSRDDRLIAFSNSHIYGGSLTAFPGAIVTTPISHHIVPYRPITGVSGTRSNPDEVKEVVGLVLEHARNSPQVTLGVIAFGQHHADNIDNTLNRHLSELNEPSLDDFFSERNEERFFIKNIERVQGDERDAIILSVGYHKDVNGNLPYRFGPILQEGGERRLNVAVTRARSQLTLVSSFSHHDMDPGRSTAKGVDLLRRYLEYASSGGVNLGADVQNIPLNPFELSIKNGLERRGIPVTPQYGVSGYRIDFACAHPKEPGRMVLAIEADGASYHSAPTARDRDRLRQQVLESKGWSFHRIWSTSWFRDREAELDKAEEAWKQAVDASDNDGLPTDVEATPVVPSGSSEPQRGPRPYVPRKGDYGYENITDFRHRQLVELALWIESDTLLRTVDDLVQEMMRELGFKRSGKRIREALNLAIKSSRR